MKKILILNGANLNLLGRREPEIYGTATFEDFFEVLKIQCQEKIELEYAQSNHEGALLDHLHRVGFDSATYEGIVLNAGAYTHTSIALRDAISAISLPVVEVHISNVHAREAFRHHSHLSGVCVGSIVGLGLKGYELAIRFLVEK
ncbi:MAG: type 3-dehydroquinate dehydratase [Bacteroidota bacterium]|jgi:3-dehydroquinate dehydratase-2